MNEHLPGINGPEDIGDKFWEKRYKSIRNFESHLHRTGTRIIKFFLHVSKEEQKQRFLKRLEDPDKNWKFSAADLKERDRWPDYMRCYQDMIRETASKHAPWIVVPADHKWFTRLVVVNTIIDALESIDLKLPTLSTTKLAELKKIRSALGRGKE
jgi:polyphosphate kinase 2 (PPK2 family)